MFDARPDALYEKDLQPPPQRGARLHPVVVLPGAALVLALSFLFFHAWI